MLEALIKKISLFKSKISNRYQSLYIDSFDMSKGMIGKGKERLEIEKLKISLKKYYYYLGKYVAKQYIAKGYSDFSLDKDFDILNKKIKKILIKYKNIKKLESNK